MQAKNSNINVYPTLSSSCICQVNQCAKRLLAKVTLKSTGRCFRCLSLMAWPLIGVVVVVAAAAVVISLALA
jgi:hypothetical protein